MELGKKIRQLRFKSSLTQEQLAEKLGINPQSVSKWENSVAMPDITLLPLLAETFGVSIDDLFDLTVEQRLNRIENRMDAEKKLPQDVFCEYEEFLKSQLSDSKYGKRATELIAYLYWHRMNSSAEDVKRWAKEAIHRDPGEKECQWMLNMAENHYIWDWNLSNHSRAIEFYRGIVDENPDTALPYEYLIDNLIADNRADEAEKYLDRLSRLEKSNPILCDVYRAYIALARFDEQKADVIMEKFVMDNPNSSACLFEAAQYRARKCDYGKAVEYYELSFGKDERRPRFIDALQGIAIICEITGDYEKAAETCDRMIDLLKNEWGMTEDTCIRDAENEKARLLQKAKIR